jgi:SAM-dependent methyltransferase
VSEAAAAGIDIQTAGVRACPVCSSVRHTVLYRQRFEAFTAGSITNAYDVVACDDCGMCYASGLPSEDRFSEYYGQSSKYDLSGAGAELSQFDSERCRDEAAFIATNVGNRETPILDVGAATGPLLAALRDAGFTRLYGVEPSPDAVRVAVDEHGLDVVVGDATVASAFGTSFGVVTLVAVLEHLVDPAAALQAMAGLLDDDGLFYLVVPDASRFSEFTGAPYQDFSVEHINYFTPQSLRILLASIGLQVSAERQTVLTLTDDCTSPALEVLCRRGDAIGTWERDVEGVESLRRYIAASAAKEANVARLLSGLADEGRGMYVWGTGTNALHLLASTRLADCNIVAFLDSNPHYTGATLSGRPVIAPAQVDRIDAPILVASAVSQSEIAAAARVRFGPDVQLILMY